MQFYIELSQTHNLLRISLFLISGDFCGFLVKWMLGYSAALQVELPPGDDDFEAPPAGGLGPQSSSSSLVSSHFSLRGMAGSCGSSSKW